jgi:hypothetical protein
MGPPRECVGCGSTQSRKLKLLASHISALEACIGEACTPNEGMTKVSSSKIRSRKIRCIELRTRQDCASQVRILGPAALKGSVDQATPCQAGPLKGGRAEVCSIKDRPLEICAVEPCPVKVKLCEICSAQAIVLEFMNNTRITLDLDHFSPQRYPTEVDRRLTRIISNT